MPDYLVKKTILKNKKMTEDLRPLLHQIEVGGRPSRPGVVAAPGVFVRACMQGG
jgi:hypothetical protein